MELFKKNNPKMKAMKQSREYNKLKKIKIFNLFSFVIISATFFFTFIFVYNYVYKTLGQIETISLIKNIRNFNSINFKTYEEALVSWESKNKEETVLVPNRDLFNKVLTITTTTSSTPEIEEGI